MAITKDGQTNGRRQFLGGLFAAGFIPAPTWADAGSPAFLSAAAKPDGSFVLCGIGADLDIRFELPLPARGHAAAAHPTRPEAVAFARRPGTFAIVIDCVTGAQKAMLSTPTGRHFYGHGAFSSDGSLLYTTENDYEAGRGRIGVWDARHGYQRIDEWDSGGIGPHDIKRLPDTNTLVVANGGIDTHPDTGRTKLNLATMAPNLAYVENGNVVEIAALPTAMHKNSIRHLAIGLEGQVAFGMQWQGDGPVAALVGTHKRGQHIALMQAPADQVRQMSGYIGSIAYSNDGSTVAVTSPRGGVLQLYETDTLRLLNDTSIADVCGIAVNRDYFVATSGNGTIVQVKNIAGAHVVRPHLSWDNHLISV
ncbi:DUF1513 domain-containing protein [Pseudopelagicola sp. nBUS_19]|uniref:DUF1513 domain-containing protein n=1 Tax=Pseudopelagicola sp. nBUS_19 TaxID=3395316 RepID=UPI003EC03A5B